MDFLIIFKPSWLIEEDTYGIDFIFKNKLYSSRDTIPLGGSESANSFINLDVITTFSIPILRFL